MAQDEELKNETMDLDWLMRVRVVVARCGEMDAKKWWNTMGQLGAYGSRLLKRGFPRTHHFAQARSVFAVAARRCDQIYDRPDATTLWRLTDEIEDAFDAHWESMVDSAAKWTPFFEKVAGLKNFDVGTALREFDLVDSETTEKMKQLKRAPGIKGVEVKGPTALDQQCVALLALGFDLGDEDLHVPYYLAGPQ